MITMPPSSKVACVTMLLSGILVVSTQPINASGHGGHHGISYGKRSHQQSPKAVAGAVASARTDVSAMKVASGQSAVTLPLWLAFISLFGPSIAVSSLAARAMRASLMARPFADDHQRRVLFSCFSFLRNIELATFVWPYFFERADCSVELLRPRFALLFYPFSVHLPTDAWRLYCVLLFGGLLLMASVECLSSSSGRSNQWRSQCYVALTVLLYTGMCFDENMIGPAQIQTSSMLLSMAMLEAFERGTDDELPIVTSKPDTPASSAWSIGRCFHAAFYFYAGVAKLNHGFLVTDGGIFSSPVGALLASGDYSLSWGALVVFINVGAASSELICGLFMLAHGERMGKLAVLGAAMASAMHVLIFLSDIVACMSAHEQCNPKLFGWSIVCLVNLYVLYLHPRSRADIKCGHGALSLFGRQLRSNTQVCCPQPAIAAVALACWIAPPAAYISRGWGHPKWMLGMYDRLTPEPTLAFLLERQRPELPLSSPLRALVEVPARISFPELSEHAEGQAPPVSFAFDKLRSLAYRHEIPDELKSQLLSNRCLPRQVPALIEDVGTGHQTAVLLWAHHLAHLARSSVTVFHTTRRSMIHGTYDVAQSTVKHDVLSSNRVAVFGPPTVVLTFRRLQGARMDRLKFKGCDAQKAGRRDQGALLNDAGSCRLLVYGRPDLIPGSVCRDHLDVALLCRATCCKFQLDGLL